MRHSRPDAAPRGASGPCASTDAQLGTEESRLAGGSGPLTHPVSAGSGPVLRARTDQANHARLRTCGTGHHRRGTLAHYPAPLEGGQAAQGPAYPPASRATRDTRSQGAGWRLGAAIQGHAQGLGRWPLPEAGRLLDTERTVAGTESGVDGRVAAHAATAVRQHIRRVAPAAQKRAHCSS